MTTDVSLDTTQPGYLWVSVVCEMKDVFNLQGWIRLEYYLLYLYMLFLSLQ